MKRRRYSDGEQDLIQKLKSENRKLKQWNSRLQKQLSRLDLDQFQNLKDVIDSQDRDSNPEKTAEKDWTCWDCKQDYLRLRIIEKPGRILYNRYCPTCKKRTKFQVYNDKVKGPR